MMNRILQGLNTSEYSTLQLCILVAAQLPSKSIRDVAARLTLLRVQIDPRSLSHKHARFRTFFVMILIVFVSRASIKLKRIPRYLAFDLALNTNLIIILSKMFVFSFQTTCVCVCVCEKDQDPDTSSLAAAAMGASAAVAGVPVPGVGVSSENSGGGSWRDPSAMFSGPNSLMDSNHPSSVKHMCAVFCLFVCFAPVAWVSCTAGIVQYWVLEVCPSLLC
jgi:hypothetical protein